MQPLRIALVQIAWSGSIESMQAQYREWIPKAAAQGASLICLPEFSLLPYFPGRRDPAGFQWAEALQGGVTDQFFGEMARKHSVSILSSTFEKAAEGRYFDTALIHTPDGVLKHWTRKVHIPAGEGYHETDFFEGSLEYPVHSLEAVQLAAPTCYDQWFPELARIYALRGAELIVYPTAIGSEPTAPHFDSRDAWQTVMRGHAVANGLFIAAVNRIGRENDVTFYGSSFVCDPTGRTLAQADRENSALIVADLDPAVMAEYRQLFPLLHQRKTQAYAAILEKAEAPLPERWQQHPGFKRET